MGRFKHKEGFTISDILLDIASAYYMFNVNNLRFLRIALEKAWYTENSKYQSYEEFTNKHFEYYITKGYNEATKGSYPN